MHRLDLEKGQERKQISNQTDFQRQNRLERKRQCNKKRKAEKTPLLNNTDVQREYLRNFNVTDHGMLHDQTWAKENILNFHKSMLYFMYKCTVCHEVWPVKSKSRSPQTYICFRCMRDKKSPKKFSIQNSMIPSPVPLELQDMSQVEEMLIARALPIMRVYIKPGGQRG